MIDTHNYQRLLGHHLHDEPKVERYLQIEVGRSLVLTQAARVRIQVREVTLSLCERIVSIFSPLTASNRLPCDLSVVC